MSGRLALHSGQEPLAKPGTCDIHNECPQGSVQGICSLASYRLKQMGHSKGPISSSTRAAISPAEHSPAEHFQPKLSSTTRRTCRQQRSELRSHPSDHCKHIERSDEPCCTQHTRTVSSSIRVSQAGSDQDRIFILVYMTMT